MKTSKISLPHIFTGIMLISAMISCDLDEYNPSGTTAEAIWSTSDGVETLIASAYKWQRKVFYEKYGFTLFETGVDLWESNSWTQITQYKGLQPDNDSGCGAVWQYLYEGINMCNIGINYIENGKVEYTDETLKTTHLAEFKFLRGWYNWILVEQWGAVTLRTEPTDGVILTARRSSVSDFYELIINDLQYAAENAPMSQDDAGRITQKAAEGLLARAALSGAYQVPDKESEYLTIAKNAADNVINNQSAYGVELYDNYADIWDEDNNKNNKEALFVITFSTEEANNESNGNTWWQLFKFNYMKVHSELIMSYEYGFKDKNKWGDPSFTYPSKALFDLYDETIDSRYEDSFRTVWKKNASDDITEPATGDTALYVSINSGSKPSPGKDYVYYNIDDIYDADGTVKAYSNPFPALKKFDSPKYNGYYKKTRYGLLDHIIIRLSEMYLIAAEVEMLQGDNANAASYINVIRNRAAKSGKEAEMQISSGDINIDFILAERAREFCGEGLRWFDLKRTGKLVEYVRACNKGPAADNIQDYHMVRPVPSEELDALENRTEYVQGLTGYNY
ncbi:MAG: RagB/SusD family nutrient uptake outer membrane protein [Mangrovibacterium sp.]